jgi:hypothetical protein
VEPGHEEACDERSSPLDLTTSWTRREGINLQLKRVLALPKRDKIRITENYSQFKLDPKVEAKAFELPK